MVGEGAKANGAAGLTRRRSIPWLPLLGLAAIASYLALTPTGGWDIWWHLQTGRVALEQGTTLPVDPFSYSFEGAPWGHKDLLAAVIFYLGFAAIGFAWFALLKALVVAGVGGAVFAAGRRLHAPDLGATAIAGLAILALQYRVVERPVMFSLVLYPLLLLLLERMRRARAAREWRAPVSAVWPVVALLWLWSLLHREALVGIGLLALEVLGTLAERLFGRRGAGSPSPSFLAATALGLAVAGALPLLSPSGLHFYTSSVAVAGSDALRAAITDWARIGPLELLRDFPATSVLLLLAVFGVASTVRRVRAGLETNPGARLVQLAALMFFAAASVADSVRWIPYASTTAALVALQAVADRGSVLGRGLARAGELRATPALALAAILGASFWLNDLGTGVGPMENRYPEGAVSFAREHRLKGRVVDAFHLGGYLIWELWPEARVLIDGRNDVVYPPEFLKRAISSHSRADVFREMRDEDRATWVVAGNIAGHSTHLFLARDPDWMLVYWSEPAVIYVERESHRDLEHLEFRYVDPAAVDASIVGAMRSLAGSPERMDSVGEEVRRMLKASPGGLRANTAAALYFHLRGPQYHARRDDVLARIESLYPDHPAAAELAARIGAD